MSHPKMHENPLPTTTSKQNAESDALNSSISEETNNNNKMTAEEATNEFFGYLVQLDCGDDGTFEGYITEVQPVMNGSSAWGKVKLEKPLRDGVPFGDDDMAIMVPGELIQDIKVLFMPDALPPKPMPRANALPQKSRFKPISGFQPVKKVTQYTPKTSSTSLNKPKPAQKYANVHPRFDAFPRNSPSNISVSRRSPSVAQSILKMKPPAVYNAQILSKFNNNNKQQQQMRATAKPFIPRTILGRPKRILSITPPIGQEATTSKKAEEVKVSMPKADEEKENSKTEGDEKKSKTDKNEGKKSVNQAKSMEEKKPKRSKKEEKRGVDNMEKGEQRVKGKKKKRSDEQEGEGSGSKVKMGKDERNRLTKEKRGDKNAEEKTKSGKKKAKEEQKEEKPLINKEDEEKLIEEEKPLSEKLEENNPLSDGKEEEQIEEKINEEMEQIDEAIVSEKDEENNKNEEEEVVATEEQLMNEVAEILENVATSIGNLEITSSTGDSSEATAELQTNTSSSSANRTESANEEQQLDDDERENNQSGLMRAEKYTGMLASIDTDAGIYQGIVAEVDPAEFTLKLEKALL